MFLNISKAFNIVWHDGVLFKLKQYGVTENLLQLITSFPSGRSQRVTLYGKTVDWETIRTGEPQGSFLGPLFFITYIKDLTNNLKRQCKTIWWWCVSRFPLETADILKNY